MSSGLRLPCGQVYGNEVGFQSPSTRTIERHQGSSNVADNQFMTPTMSLGVVETDGTRVRNGDSNGVVSGEEPVENVGGSTSRGTGKKKFHRHSAYQTQALENFFKICPQPDDKDRKTLSSDLGLNPLQIKFWFQNKRTQLKKQNEKHENLQSRQENDTLCAENMRLRDTLGNSPCRACGGPSADLSLDEHHLRMENARLKSELQKIQIDLMTNASARCIDNPMPWVPQTSMYENGVIRRELCISAHHPRQVIGPTLDLEKQVVANMAYTAMDELVQMTQTLEPLWIPVAIDGYTTYLLNQEEYSRSLFRTWPRRPGFRSEATRDSATIKTSHTNIINVLMDVNQWANLFCAIVAKAIPLEQLATGHNGTYDGALQLLHAEYQMISPLVQTRETNLVRYCKQQGEGIWFVVDVSLEGMEDDSLMIFRKRASGCVIQQLPNGYSKITWIENTEVEDKGNDGIFRSVISSGVAFGAKYWLSILNGQFERFSCCGATNLQVNEANNIEGRKSLLKLAERMVTGFCSKVGASSANNWTTVSHIGRDEVKVMTHNSVNEQGRHNGIVISVATSVFLPTAPRRVFEYLFDENNRAEWDIVINGANMYQMANITTGELEGNAIKLSRVNGMSQNPNSMLILQESFAYPTGFFIVYSPIDLHATTRVLEGGDTTGVPLLPSGFAIFPDCSSGSLLTLSLQVLVDSTVDSMHSLSDVTTVNNLMSHTLDRVRAFFGMPSNSEQGTSERA